MSSAAAIATLRARIARRERLGDTAWPAACLGDDEIDAALPAGGLYTGALYECLPASPGDFPATLGFGLGLLSRILHARPGPVLWALPAWQTRDHGALYPQGLASFGIDPALVVHVTAAKAETVLWALDEALQTRAVAAAVALLPATGRAYDFTASRRLAMRAACHGTTALILAARPQFSMATACEMRWSVAAAPSAAIRRPGQAMAGLGAPRWHIRVTKSRRGAAGQWHVEWDHETLSFRLAAPLAGRAPQRASGNGAGQWIAA